MKFQAHERSGNNFIKKKPQMCKIDSSEVLSITQYDKELIAQDF